MKKIRNMTNNLKPHLRLRNRLRTTTKLAIIFGISSVISITVSIVLFIQFSNTQTTYGTGSVNEVINGQLEVMDEKLPTDFEIKELDATSPTMANDTVVLFKKMN
jgi:hypothetical protein